MTFEKHFYQPMQMGELLVIMLIVIDRHLINALDRDFHHPVIQK